MTNQAESRKPGPVKALIGLEMFSGGVGVASGTSFIRDPSGKSNGMDVEILEGTPVGDFFLVGLLLFIGFGIVPLIISWGLITKRAWGIADALTKWSHRHWAWAGALLISVVELIWIAGEAALIGIFSITIAWACLQIALIGILNLNTVKRFYLRAV